MPPGPFPRFPSPPTGNSVLRIPTKDAMSEQPISPMSGAVSRGGPLDRPSPLRRQMPVLSFRSAAGCAPGQGPKALDPALRRSGGRRAPRLLDRRTGPRLVATDRIRRPAIDQGSRPGPPTQLAAVLCLVGQAAKRSEAAASRRSHRSGDFESASVPEPFRSGRARPLPAAARVGRCGDKHPLCVKVPIHLRGLRA